MPRASPRRDSAAQRRGHARAARAERQMARALKLLAKEIGRLARETYDRADPLGSSARLRDRLRRYGEKIRPWAEAVARRMVADVRRRDDAAWAERSKTMERALRLEVASAPVGAVVAERLESAARLIRSMPAEAADRAVNLAREAVLGGKRAGEVYDEVMRTGHVTESRARTIARTEASTAAGAITEARARHVGSEGYIWRTANDVDVRREHRALAGTFVRWNEPPVAGPNSTRYHAGCGPNCRCWMEVVLADEPPLARGAGAA